MLVLSLVAQNGSLVPTNSLGKMAHSTFSTGT
jgi:hypothetical protein